jgi:hypothetical protein
MTDASASAPKGVRVFLNGRYLDFEQPPVNTGGWVLVPMRAIFESLGAEVGWDGAAKKATGIKGARRVELTIDSDTVFIDGKAVKLDAPARNINGYTMAPVRAVAEGLDAKVEWEGVNGTILITP